MHTRTTLFWQGGLSPLLLVLGLLGCEQTSQSPTYAGRAQETNGTIFITDRTGERWDITHAVRAYGFSPDKFQHGVGKNTIRPLINPHFLAPGEPGYPADSDDFLVLGVEIGGEARAYPLSIMSRHEVSNEEFGGTAAAPAY